MKKISYLLLLFFSAIVCGCSEYEQPYVGYIVVERAVLDAAANSSTTVIADTDISSDIVVDNVDADWCQVSVNGKEITVTATSANTDSSYRTATVSVTSGYRQATFTVLQKYDAKNFCSMIGLVGLLPVMVLKPVMVVVIPACLRKNVRTSGIVRTVILCLFLIFWKLI